MARELRPDVIATEAADTSVYLENPKSRLLAKIGLTAGALACTAAAATARPNKASAEPMLSPDKMYGVFESSRLDLAAEAGFKFVEKDLWVTPGHRNLKELPQADQDDFRNYMALARQKGQQVILNLWQVGWPVNGKQYTPPNRPHQWRDMCDVAIDAIQAERTDAQEANLDPAITGLVVGVEPNSRYFWKTQKNAGRAYENWLATCFDKVKDRFPEVAVYGGSLASRGDRGGTGPGAFITQMCRAYKDSGRQGPIMDGFDMHSYQKEPPETTHPNTDVITLGDYDKLESILQCFGQGDIPILWGEIGYESDPPAYQAYRYNYKNKQRDGLDETTQGQYYANAIKMVQKQPNSLGLFIFHLVDDPNMARWQSGLYYANPKRRAAIVGGYADASKKSLPIVQSAINSAQN